MIKHIEMKKIIYILAAAAMVQGCNFLDFDETSSLYTREDMYAYFGKAKEMLTNVYGYMPQDFGVVSKAMRDCGCDDAEFGDPNNIVQNFNNGSWTPSSVMDTQWGLYNGVRAANEFIESIGQADFSRFENEPQYENWKKQLEFFPYEARVLRAFYFFELARRYGDIAMPMKMLTPDEANTIGKTPFADVIKFIADECYECSKVLPDDYLDQPDHEFGRVTKGFALAVRSKALLYAASRLHNPSMDKAKWEMSAEAAHDIIALNLYSLDPGAKVNDVDSPEVVLFRMNNNSSTFELDNFPIRFTEGKRTYSCGTYPTQELVDAFQTKNGYDIILGENGWETDDPDFDISRPYEGRDPRFARTVLADGMAFKGDVIETFEGGKDYFTTRDRNTPTGYFLRKYIEETTSFTPEALVSNKHHWIVYRYAETLLTFAESMVEAGHDPADKGEYTLSALDALNQVRRNAGMPDVNATGREEFLEAIRREWRVEFAFEDHRFWDVRRWCIGEDTQTGISGVSIKKTGDGLQYSRVKCETRVWNDRMNLYPIPQSELFNNPHLNPQNPGW